MQEARRCAEVDMTLKAKTFAEAIAERDADGLRAVFAPDVDFKAVTPGRFWEATEPSGVVEVVLGHWFEETDHISSVLDADDGEPVGDTCRMSYRFDITNDDGRFVVEQQAYYRTAEDQISYLRVVCSGYRPVDVVERG
jgi:hypothetical protein